MTSPFPTQFNNQVIREPGIGDVIASGLANVLAAQQKKREEEYRQQQLAAQIQQQNALAEYYRGTVGVQQQEQARLRAEAEAKARGQAQVGGAIRRALGGETLGAPRPMAEPSRPAAPQMGNATQAAPGLVTQALGASVPSATTEVAAPGIFEQLLGGAADALDPHMRAAVFNGVSDENLPAAVEAVRAVQPQPTDLPASSREFGYYTRLKAVDPQRAEEYRRLFLEKAPSAIITNIAGQGETEFSKKWAEAQVKILSQGMENATGATQMFPVLNEAYGLVARGKAFTGFGANQLLGLARVASAIGAPLPPDWKPGKDRAADSQVLLKLLREQTLSYLQTRALGSGTAVSDKDREFMERQAGADLTLDPIAIKRIIRVNVGTGLMKAQEAIADLRDQAITYPANAAQLERQATTLERKLGPMRQRYAQMLQAEEATEQDLRTRMTRTPGIVLPGGVR